MSNRRPIRTKDVHSPNRILNNLISDYLEGNLDDYTFLFRALVLEVDYVGGQLQQKPALNPPNSVKARIVTNSIDKDVQDEDLEVFWPLFSHDIMPVKEGEHIYVTFEQIDKLDHGLWFARIPEPNNVYTQNIVPGSQKYEDNKDNDVSKVGLQKAVQDTDIVPSVINVSTNFTSEKVPKFTARIGDRVIEGSNNTVIVLGRDRSDGVGSGQKDQAGSIDLVAGRSQDGDLSFSDDKSRVYVSMKTDIDTNLATQNDPGIAVNGEAAVIIKSDEVRIVAREGMKIVVEGGDLHLEGSNVFLGKDAQEALIKGDAFNTLWKDLLTQLALHNHPSPVPNSPSPGLGKFGQPQGQELGPPNNILSTTVKVKD